MKEKIQLDISSLRLEAELNDTWWRCVRAWRERGSESAACNYHDLCVNLLKGTMGLISLLLCLITHSKLTFIIFYYNCDQGAWLQHVSSANISQAKSLVLQMISPIPLPLKKLPWQAVNWILKLIYFLLISPWKYNTPI